MRGFVIVLLSALAACGGEDRPAGDCVPADTDRLLPYAVGYSWTYEVTNIDTQETSTKTQSVLREMDNPDDGMPVMVQETNKVEGRTVSWMRTEGEALIRLQQEDYDPAGALERTTVYDPGKIRLDESAERVAAGASFDESYTAVIYDPAGIETAREARTEQWQVLSVGQPCPGDFADYDCLQIQRARVGTPAKIFWFAPGIGKVRETGGQIEQLTACSLE